MIVNSQRRTLARHLRSQGLSYRKIQKQVGSSLDSIFRWCKDVNSDGANIRTNEQVRVNPTLTVRSIDDKGRGRISGKSKTNSKGNYKGKTFPLWAGIFIIALVVVFTFYAMWLRQPEPEPEQTNSKKRTNEQPRPPDGLDGRNLADLDEIENLPGEELPDEDIY